MYKEKYNQLGCYMRKLKIIVYNIRKLRFKEL